MSIIELPDSYFHLLRDDIYMVIFKNGLKYQGQINKNYLPHGNGILYYQNGNIFTGSFNNGKELNGKLKNKRDATITNITNQIFSYTNHLGDIYIGNITSPILTGKFKCKYHNGDEYNGDFVNSKKHGEGEYVYKNGNVFIGTYENDSKVYGKFITKNGNFEYTGSFKNNLPNDEVSFKYNDCWYHGKFVDGVLNTDVQIFRNDVWEPYDFNYSNNVTFVTRKLIYRNGDTYEGEFVQGCIPNGKGVLTFKSGSSITGIFSNGVPHGKCKYTCDIGCYEGEYVNGVSNIGKWEKNDSVVIQGKFSNYLEITGYGNISNNINVYIGGFKNGLKVGNGKLITPNSVFEGMFLNDKKNGLGMLNYKYMTFQGNFINDIPSRIMQITYNKDKMYVGAISNYTPHGYGVMQVINSGFNNSLECGMWVNGKFNDRATPIYPQCDDCKKNADLIKIKLYPISYESDILVCEKCFNKSYHNIDDQYIKLLYPEQKKTQFSEKDFICPLSGDIFEDPVSYGNHIYERSWLLQWFEHNQDRPSPLTRQTRDKNGQLLQITAPPQIFLDEWKKFKKSLK
jgi:hypothetical protein